MHRLCASDVQQRVRIAIELGKLRTADAIRLPLGPAVRPALAEAISFQHRRETADVHRAVSGVIINSWVIHPAVCILDVVWVVPEAPQADEVMKELPRHARQRDVEENPADDDAA